MGCQLAWRTLGGGFVSLPQVPGFTLTRRLGAGSTGTVWSATRDADGAPVAIKLVTGPADDRGDPGTPRVPGDARGAGRPRGRDPRGPRPPARRAAARGDGPHGRHAGAGPRPGRRRQLRVGRDRPRAPAPRGAGHLAVAGQPGLAHLHALGVVHADLSPGNVLFTREGRPMVSDLGVARLFGERPETLHGTEGFTAPEVLMGAQPTPASDVYAIGALAWSASPARRPSCPRSGRGLESVVRDQPVRLVQLVERCLSPTLERVRPLRPSPWTCTTRRWPSRCSSGTAPTLRRASRTASAPRPGPRRHPSPSATAPAAVPTAARGSSRRPGAMPLRSAARGDPPSARAAAVPDRVGRNGLAPRAGTAGPASPPGLPQRSAVSRCRCAAGAASRGGPRRGRRRLGPRFRRLGPDPLLVDHRGAPTPLGAPTSGAAPSLAAGAGAAAARGPATVAQPSAGAPAGATHVRAELRSAPQAVLQRLADARARAYELGNVRLLGAVDVPGSPAQAHDQQVIRGAVSAGATYAALRYVVRSAQTTSADGDRATVRARWTRRRTRWWVATATARPGRRRGA